MGPIGCPETSVRNYHHSLRNNPYAFLSSAVFISIGALSTAQLAARYLFIPQVTNQSANASGLCTAHVDVAAEWTRKLSQFPDRWTKYAPNAASRRSDQRVKKSGGASLERRHERWLRKFCPAAPTADVKTSERICGKCNTRPPTPYAAHHYFTVRRIHLSIHRSVRHTCLTSTQPVALYSFLCCPLRPPFPSNSNHHLTHNPITISLTHTPITIISIIA